jgi:hypothetical protein
MDPDEWIEMQKQVRWVPGLVQQIAADWRPGAASRR